MIMNSPMFYNELLYFKLWISRHLALSKCPLRHMGHTKISLIIGPAINICEHILPVSIGS